MRYMKLLAVLGLILAVSGTAGALTYIPFRYSYDGPVVAHINNLTQASIYTGYLADGRTPVTLGTWYKPADLQYVPGNAINPPADLDWSIFQVDAIYKGTSVGYNNIVETDTHNPLYIHGDGGVEVVGSLFGRSDLFVKFTSQTEFSFEAAGDYAEVFVQPVGTASPGGIFGAAGSSGRVYDANSSTYLNKYDTIGYDSAGNLLGDGPALILESKSGYFGDTAAAVGDPNHELTETAGNFQIDESHGVTDGYYSVVGGTDAAAWDSDFFNPNSLFSPKPWANNSNVAFLTDIRLHVTNDPIGYGETPGYDWPIYSSDPLRANHMPAVPEPLTVMGAFLGLSGLGGYIRRRRRD